jgi:hypothetical protein
MKLLIFQSMFPQQNPGPAIGGFIVTANPEVCSHNNVHFMDGCGSWIFSFVYSLKNVQILKENTISGADTSFIVRRKHTTKSPHSGHI